MGKECAAQHKHPCMHPAGQHPASIRSGERLDPLSKADIDTITTIAKQGLSHGGHRGNTSPARPMKQGSVAGRSDDCAMVIEADNRIVVNTDNAAML